MTNDFKDEKATLKNKERPYVYVCKKIKDCTECMYMQRIRTPDPDDWFNDDDQIYVCTKLNRTLSKMNRPYEKQPIPDDCPFIDDYKE